MYGTVLKSINLDSSNRRTFHYALTKPLRIDFCFILQVNFVRTTPFYAAPLRVAALTHWCFTNAWWVYIRNIWPMNTVHITGF